MDDQIQPPPSREKEFNPIWIKWIFDFYKFVLANVSKDFFFEVNAGRVNGHTMRHKFGFSDQVSTTHNHIWNAPTAISLAWQQTAAQYDVYSSDANDDGDPAGTGAHEIQLECLLADFTTHFETVTLDGTTAVTTTEGPYIRCQSAQVPDLAVGTYSGSNIGNIRIEVTSGGAKTGDLQGYIEATEGQTQKTQYTVPANKTVYMQRVSITVDSNKSTKIELHVRTSADITSTPMGPDIIKHQWDGLISPVQEEFKANHIFVEKTDLWFDAEIGTGSGAIVELDYDMVLVDN